MEQKEVLVLILVIIAGLFIVSKTPHYSGLQTYEPLNDPTYSRYPIDISNHMPCSCPAGVIAVGDGWCYPQGTTVIYCMPGCPVLNYGNWRYLYYCSTDPSLWSIPRGFYWQDGVYAPLKNTRRLFENLTYNE